ncbi:MAG TPA: efflux RND transporter periplasmic adaptor subunit, partial [Polyangiaceae bacterium]
FSPVVSATGKASFDPEQVASIGASALGTVRRVAKYEGESVKRGEVLAEIGSPSQAGREAAGSLRAQQLPLRTLGVSLLRSPLDGTVVERRIVTGQSVRGERIVFVVANLDRLLVSLSVDEAQARGLLVGDRVELSRDESAGALSTGRVTEVLPGPVGSKLQVRIGVDNRARGLRAGQAVNARIFASNAGRALLVPNRALAWIGGQPAVFVAAGVHTASAAAVTLGGGDGQQTEVRLGLASGQRIVSDGVPKLKEASFL